eukprot:SAG22_NODE_241_length_14126_cov_9.747202_8_plen_175_part_00
MSTRNARRQLLRGRGVVTVGVGDGLIAHVAVELLAPVRHPLRERAGEFVPSAGSEVGPAASAKTDVADVAVRHGAIVEHRERPVEVGVAYGEVVQLLPCRYRSGKAAVEAAVGHVEGLHVHEGADSVWNGAYEVGAEQRTVAQGRADRSRERGRGVSTRLSASAPPARHAAAGG